MSQNLSLNVKEMEEHLYHTSEQRVMNQIGIQYIFRFLNNYGASIVKAYGTEGFERDLWELCVIYFEPNELSFPSNYKLVYPTKITPKGTAKGNLTDEDIYKMLKEIQKL